MTEKRYTDYKIAETTNLNRSCKSMLKESIISESPEVGDDSHII